MHRRAQKRYILYNAAIWVIILGAGLVALVAARQYGRLLVKRREAHGLVRDAETAYDQGRLLEAQRLTRRALRDYPAMSAAVIETFGERLLAMPLVFDALNDFLNEPPEDNDALLAAAKGQIILGKDERAKHWLKTYIEKEGPDPRAHLYLARLLFDEGRAEEAKILFDRYRERSANQASAPEETTETREQDKTSLRALIDRGRNLFYLGRWPEAFDVFGQAAALKPDHPDVVFFNAFAAEQAGRIEAAVEGYRRALSSAPNHRLSRVRLKALGKAD